MSSLGFAPPPPKRVAPPEPFVSRLPSPPTPELPAEVLSRILNYTLPRAQQPAAFTRRYKLLATYSLVCRRWRTVSQALLFQHVHLPTVPTAFKYNMVTKPLGVLYGRGTQTLRLGGEWNESTPSFHRHGYVLNSLVTSMPFLTEVWLEEAAFDPAVLSCAQDLKILHLRDVELKYPDEKDRFHWRLPRLHTLYMANTSVIASDRTWLSPEPLFTPCTLPSLTKLFYIWHKESSPPELERIGPQLTHLYLFRISPASSTTQRPPHIPPDLFAQLSSLKHLFFDVRELSELYLLNSLASPILSLQLRYSDRSSQRVEETLVECPLPESLLDLETLFLPPPPEGDVKMNPLHRLVLPKWREKLEEWIDPAEVQEVDGARYDFATDEAAMAWVRRTSEVIPTETTRPRMAAPIETIVLDDDVEEEDQEMEPAPDGFVDDTDDEEMQEAVDLMEVLRNDVDYHAEDFYDAEADDSLDGEAIDIR